MDDFGRAEGFYKNTGQCVAGEENAGGEITGEGFAAGGEPEEGAEEETF